MRTPGIAERIGPAKGTNSKKAGEDPEDEPRLDAEQPQARAGQRADDEHRDQLALEPQPQRMLGFVERLREQPPLRFRDQLDRTGAVKSGLGGEEHAAEKDDEEVGDAVAGGGKPVPEPRHERAAVVVKLRQPGLERV